MGLWKYTGPLGMAAGFAAASLMVAGCGSRYPQTIEVGGVVQYRSQPLTNGVVMFNPVGDAGRVATSAIAADGRFKMSTFTKGDGVLPGEYRITVQSYAIGPNADAEDPETRLKSPLAVPARYGDPATSDLRCTVTADSGRQDLVLELTGDIKPSGK